MRIGINTLAVVPGRSGGDATYTRYLVEQLAQIDAKNDYFLFVAPYNREWFDIRQGNFRMVSCNIPNNFSLRVLWEHSCLGIAASQMRLDVFHAPVNISPALLRGPTVVTVHDSVYTSREYPMPIRLYWRIFRPLSARRADRIIAVSEQNRRELVELGAIDERKVEVIYHGIHAGFRPLDRTACRQWVRQSFGIDRPFLIWVGRPYASKNLVRLVEAFALFNAHAGGQYLLALAGPEGWDDPAIGAAIQRNRVEQSVRRLGYVENTELPMLYNAAEALAFPSLEESFGFPVVEAMACGTPVVASNRSGLPEITAGAAELVDPLSVQAIADGLIGVVLNPERCKALVGLGLRRAQDFDWSKNAARTLQIYESVGLP